MRGIARQIYAMKREVAGRPDMELKAVKLLTRTTFRRNAEHWALTDAFFNQAATLPITVFAISMERPTEALPETQRYLPNQFRYLLQRVNALCERDADMATIPFDGVDMKAMAPRFESYLHRSLEGQGLIRIADAPYFVDSKVTAGIQIADMLVGVVRLWAQHDLANAMPPGDDFLTSVGRYYRIVESLTVNFGTLPGMYRMPDRAHRVIADQFGGG